MVPNPTRKYNGTILANPNNALLAASATPSKHGTIDPTSGPANCLAPTAIEELSDNDVLEINTIIARSKARRNDARLHFVKSFDNDPICPPPYKLSPSMPPSIITGSTSQQPTAQTNSGHPLSPEKLPTPDLPVSPALIPTPTPPLPSTIVPIQLRGVKKEKLTPNTPEKTTRKYTRKTKPLTLL